MVFAQCTTEIFGLAFGPKNECDRGSKLPRGMIVPWYSKEPIPSGWIVCGQTSDTPNLNGKFLAGTSSAEDIGKTGGTAMIPSDGKHTHKGRTSTNLKSTNLKKDPDERTHSFRCEGECDLQTQHAHEFELPSVGDHNHGGENRPPYYTVLFLCRSQFSGAPDAQR